MLELIIFDLDGVVADTEPLSWRVQAEVMTEVGLPITADDISAYVGWTATEMYADLERRFGRPVPPDAVARIRREMVAAIGRELAPMPGLVAFLDGLPAGLSVCIASNGSHPRVVGTVEVLGLAEYFAPHIYTADQVARGKPAPDLFRHAAAERGVAAPGCLVIEDSLHGIRAALAAGMTVFGFTGASHFGAGHGDTLAAAGARRVFGHMAELPALIAAQFGAD